MLHTRGRECLLALMVLACSRPAAPVRVDGSAGVAPLVTALAADYRTRNPSDSFEITTGLGSGERVRAVADGRIDVAMASHGINVDEIRRAGLAVHEIARTAVVFAVNASVPVEQLTRAQLCDLFAGRVARWQQLGGSAQPVVVLMRPMNEVDAEIAMAAVDCLRTGGAVSPSVRIIERPDSMAASLASTPGAIGLTSRTFADQSAGRIKPVALDGIAPSAENVEGGRYALIRGSYLITRTAPPPGVTRFLEYVRSADGQKVIGANGAVPAR